MLKECVKISDISVNRDARDWEDAIAKSSEYLLEEGVIEQRYVEAMITSVKTNGPYIVIAPHVALAHARPEYGVNRMGMTFTTLKKGIPFGSASFDPVKLIIVLAATGNDTHLELMGELAEILMEPENMKRLFQAKTAEAFYQVLIGE